MHTTSFQGGKDDDQKGCRETRRMREGWSAESVQSRLLTSLTDGAHKASIGLRPLPFIEPLSRTDQTFCRSVNSVNMDSTRIHSSVGDGELYIATHRQCIDVALELISRDRAGFLYARGRRSKSDQTRGGLSQFEET